MKNWNRNFNTGVYRVISRMEIGFSVVFLKQAASDSFSAMSQKIELNNYIQNKLQISGYA